MFAEFLSAESVSFGVFQKNQNVETFQIECLWNFLLVVIKGTKQSCCHGNQVSRKRSYHIWEKREFHVLDNTENSITIASTQPKSLYFHDFSTNSIYLYIQIHLVLYLIFLVI